jgi:hypothetical protein
MNDEQQKIEFWAQQAAMWHEKYKSVLQIEGDCHRYRVALERIAEARNDVTRERVRLIARNALDGE